MKSLHLSLQQQKINKQNIFFKLYINFGTYVKISTYTILRQVVIAMEIKQDKNLMGKNFLQAKVFPSTVFE